MEVLNSSLWFTIGLLISLLLKFFIIGRLEREDFFMSLALPIIAILLEYLIMR